MDHKKFFLAASLLFLSPIVLAAPNNSKNVSQQASAKDAQAVFERGIANFKKHRYYAAIKDFKRYDRLRPGEAKIYELMGRCYAILAKPKEAEHYFTLAERDPKLRPNMMRFKRGLRLIGDLPERGGDTPWAFNASFGAGYNSNVIALGNNFALPTDITRQSSQFAEAIAYGHYRLMKDDESSLRVLYQYLGNFYENLSQMNLQNPFIALEYQRAIDARTNFSLNVSSDNSWLGANRFSSFATVKPRVTYQADAWNMFELVYAYSNANFFTPTTAVFNRDGFTHLLSINDYVMAPNSDLSVRFGNVIENI